MQSLPPVASDATSILEIMGQLDVAIERSASFLLQSTVTTGTAVGWPLYQGAPDVANWGGTLDALRALARANYLSYSPIASQAQTSLLKAQHKDGGWGSWEIHSSNVETTAWSLIALRSIGQSQTPAYVSGVNYLRGAKHTSEPAWGAYQNADLRLYPTIIASWAMSESDPQLASAALTWVLSQSNQDGGFGYSPGSATVPCLSALFIVACEASKVLLSPSNQERILENLLRSAHSDWTWDGDYEEWVAVEDSRQRRSIPTNTKHFTTAWVIMALCKPSCAKFSTVAFNSGLRLLQLQQPDGSWLFSDRDAKRYIWCTANGLIALCEFRDWLLGPAGRVTTIQAVLGSLSVAEASTVATTLVSVNQRVSLLYKAVGILSTLIITDVIVRLSPVVSVTTTAIQYWLSHPSTTRTDSLVVGLLGSIILLLLGYLYRLQRESKRH